LGDQLQAMGVERGDRVAIVLPNGIEAIVLFLAAASVATAAPLNPAYKQDEFKFYIEDTGAKVLITSEQTGVEARAVVSSATIQLGASLDGEGRVSLSPDREAGQAPSGRPPGPEDVALVLHTSGTTSRPKRVPLAHGNLAVSARNVVDTYELTADDVALCVMPLFHIHGLVASTVATFLSGGTVVAPPRFNALDFWPMVREQGVTWFSAVPSMHQALLSRAGRGKAGEIGSERLRFIRSCSAALPATVMREMEDRFGVPVLEAYGMTEAAHQMASNPLPPAQRYPGAVGFGTGVGIGIMDDVGELLDRGAQGEVVIQGPNVTAGYEDNPEANAASFTNGWFRTGDRGYLDERDCLYLVGRIKELINRSGEKISPLEIDEVLLSHPAVSEAVAFGVPHRVHGEEPAAAVVLSAPAAERELIQWCRESLAPFKCPRAIHIVDAIPRTATGKVQRRIVAATITGGSVG
jgi:acyl-CoA synthetase (AMP-forming)/AMP-acid ligase II